MHHLYLGILIILIGLWIAIDDIYQHLRQRKEPSYTSPLHRWYIKNLYHYKWVRAINDWFDRMLQ